MTGGRRFSHAIADGERITAIVTAVEGGTEILAISDDPAARAHVVDFPTQGEIAAASEAELAVRVRNEEQLENALEELDPEVLVLSGTLDEVLDLLPDVPAGKLAIADLPSLAEEDVEELERAGFDAVLTRES